MPLLPIHYFQINRNIPCLPQKFCISIVFKFPWEDCKSQEKSETMLMQNFWGVNKVHYGNVKVANFLYLTYENIQNTTRWKSAQTSYW